MEYDDEYEYLSTISKYFEKNSTCIYKAMDKDESMKTELIYLAAYETSYERNFEWCEMVFDLYNKTNKVPRKEDFEHVLKDERFDKMSKQCKEMITKNHIKYCPKYTY